jgi:salicylate biosynthesis isochorismate synthase
MRHTHCRPNHSHASPPDSGPEIAIAAARLRRSVELAGRKARAVGRPILAWTTTRIARVELLALFDHAACVAGDRVLWECPSDQFGVVGAGSAWKVASGGSERFKRVGAAWRSLLDDAVGDEHPTKRWGAGPVLIGGFAFAPEGPTSAEWDGYPAGGMILPRMSVMSAGDASWLTFAVTVGPECRAAVDAEGEVAACVQACAGALCRAPTASEAGVEAAPRLVEEFPAGEIWKQTVRGAAAAVREGLLTKVVLARAIRMGADRFHTVRILRRLRTAHPSCTLFAVARADRCFLGATPERLVRLEDGQVSVAAVAGSAPRGGIEAEDARLGKMLLMRSKDRLEQAVVVNELRAALAGICPTVSADAEPELLKTGNVQHLYTALTGALRDPRTVLELADLLHPTSAVGGLPRDRALLWIAEHEGLDRGWYAGPVGWMDRAGNGEFAVAIRSALVRRAEALLFAGCGIVAHSDPDREYAESSLKLRSVLSALNGAQAQRSTRGGTS